MAFPFWCETCNRGFVNHQAIQQHFDNSAVHQNVQDDYEDPEDYESENEEKLSVEWCQTCEREFVNHEALQQHLDHSAAHRYNYDDEIESEESYDSEYYDDTEEEECDEYFERAVWDCKICNRSFGTEHARHQHYRDAPHHSYCVSCQRLFQNEQNLRQHMNSKIHNNSTLECPWCKIAYSSASALTIHLESGNCASGLDRTKIKQFVQQLDRNHVITRPMLTMGEQSTTIKYTATQRAWNGRGYECYFCHRQFTSLTGLNSHLNSPAHEQAIYRCPNISCQRSYKLLSGLIQHIESEACGLMRFQQVQKEVGRGIQDMVGRMLE